MRRLPRAVRGQLARRRRSLREFRPAIQALEAREMLSVTVGDAGFEDVQLPQNTFTFDPTGSAWTFTGNAGLTANQSPIADYSMTAPQGQQAAFFQVGGGVISQQVVADAAGSYQVAFSAAQRHDNHQDFEVEVDGAVVATFAPAYGQGYQRFVTPAFSLAAGSHTLAFAALDSVGGDNTAFLDDVAINPTTPGVPVVGDGDFESVPVGVGNYRYEPSDSFWDFEGESGVSGNDSDFTQGNPNAPDGSQVGFLQGSGSLFQTVVDWSAGSYQVAFSAAQRGIFNSAVEDFQVLVDGAVVGTFTPTGVGYRTYATPTFAATAGSHVLSFRGLDSAGGDNTAFLDDITADRVLPSASIASGVGASYSGGFVAIPGSVQSGDELSSYLAARPVVAAPAFDATFTPVAAGYGAWLANDGGSNWIAPGPAGQSTAALAPFVDTADGYTADGGAPQGLYYFTTKFFVPAGSTPQLSGGRWAEDNQGMAIFLNGVAQPQAASSGFSSFAPFALDPADFQVGMNTLTFVEFNEAFGTPHYTPTGFRAEGTIDLTPPTTSPSAPTPHALSGRVFDDANDDGRVEPGEPGVGGVTVALSGTDGQGHPVAATTVTGRDGSYSFAGLAPGTYTVSEVHPAGQIDGRAAIGNLGGTPRAGQVAGIAVASADGTGYNFGLDRPPTFTSTAPTEVAAGNTYSYRPSATDPDADTLTYTLLAGPAGAAFDPATGRITWAASASPYASQAVSLLVADGRGGTAEQDYTLRVVTTPNRPPIFTSTPVVDAYVGQAYSYQATAFDPDFDPLTFSSLSALLGGETFTAAGLTSWTPTMGDLGPHAVRLQVSDGRGGTAEQDYTIVVHPPAGYLPPVITSTPVVDAPASAPYFYQVEAYSPEGYPLTYRLAPNAPADMTINPQTGLLEWDHPTALAYTPVTVIVEDDHDGTATQSFQLVSDTEVIGSGEGTDEFSPYDAPSSGSFRGPTTVDDPEDGRYPLVETARSGNFPQPFAPARVDSLGSEIQPIDDHYQVVNSVPYGGLSGFYRRYFDIPGPLASPSITITANADDFGAVFLNGHLITATGSNGQPLPDDDADAYTFAEFSNTDGQETTQVRSVDPNFFVAGQNELLFVVSNSGGGPTGLSYKAAITLGTGDIPPVIDSAPPTHAHAGGPYEYRVAAHSPTGLGLTYALAPGAPAGMTIDPHSGVVTWPDAVAASGGGPYSITVDVTDADGAAATPQTYPLTVGDAGTNSPPELTNQPGYAATVGSPYRYAALATDADGDPIRFSLPVAPAGMSVDPITGVLTWTPTADEVGLQDLVLALDDGRGGVKSYPFNILVAPQVRPPVITSVPATAVAGVPYDFHLTAFDPNGEDYQTLFRLVGADNIPGLQIQAQDLVWDDPIYQAGGYQLGLIADDGHGGVSDTLPFTLTVVRNPVVTSPTITSTYRTSIAAGSTYYYQVVANDPGGYPLQYSLADTDGLPGSIAMDATGLVAWTTPTVPGTYTFHVQATDGLSPAADQAVTVDVATQVINHDPVITTTALRSAVTDQEYSFQLAGYDPDNDPLEWSLVDAPDGMYLDPTTGRLDWEPDGSQLGTAPVTVRLRDGQGGSATATFAITVRGADLPPEFDPVYPPPAAAGYAYTYQVQAFDPQGGPLQFQFAPGTAQPGGMAITADGLITWANPQNGPYTVVVQATDDEGISADQAYTLTVSPQPPVPPPTIGGHPGAYAAVGVAYRAALTATAPNNDAVQFTTVPSDPTGFAITNSGAITWTPTSANPSRVFVTVVATDQVSGEATALTYAIAVRAGDAAPSIAPIPEQTLTTRTPYAATPQATDPDGDALTWSVSQAGSSPPPTSLEIVIDPASGRITWAGSATVGLYQFEVTATDPYGLSDTKVVTLDVVADTTPPTVGVLFDPASPVAVGTRVTFVVVASDASGIASVGLIVDGRAVPLDANNSASIVIAQAGAIVAAATATDNNGNQGSGSATLQAYAPSTAAPLARLIAYEDPNSTAATAFATPTTITAPEDILGTVATADGTGPVSYTLEAIPVAGGDPVVLNSADGAHITDGVLGRFDPTMLPDGSYTLQLTTNDGTYTTTVDQVVNVEGQLKLGNLHLSFTDLTIPVAGIPITITRSYDTLNADKQGDFGYGWTLDEGDFQLQLSQPDGSLTGMDVNTPFTNGTHIEVTRPGMDPEGFTFYAQPINDGGNNGFGFGFDSGYFEPTYIPDPGVTDKLTVPYAELVDLGDGTYGSADDLNTFYNPADPTFGGNGQFTLTTRQGLAYVLDAGTGQLASATDRDGNTLTYDSSGIYSSTGRAVTFVRDDQGRIVEIDDPRGGKITYGYDAAGDLVSMVDRANNAYAAATDTPPAATTFVYGASQPHYLSEILDPAGHVVARAAYDPTSGRLSGLADADGQTTTTAYNIGTLSESITPPAVAGSTGQASTITFDKYGDPTGATDALGHSTSASYVATGSASQPTALGSQTQVVNGVTETTSYAYNDDGTVKSSTDATGATTYYSYGGDSFGLPSTITDPLGHATRIGYDADGNTTSTTSPGGLTTTTTYTTDGQVASSTTPDGTTSYTYDPYGDVQTSTDARGVTTTYTYDHDGNQQSSSYVWVNPATGIPTTLTTTNDYDGEDRLVRSVDAQGNLTDTVYDADGRAAWVDDPHQPGAPATGTQTTYDAAGRVIRTEQFDDVVIAVTPIGGEFTSAFVSSGAPISISSTVYDARGQAVWSDDAHLPGQAVDGTFTEYNDDGTVKDTQAYQGVDIELRLDTNGVLESYLANSPTPLAPASSSTYLSNGQVATSTDGSGHAVAYGYDADGRQTTTTDTVTIMGANGPTNATRTTTSTYDAAGRLTATTDALGHTTTYTLDADGRTTLTTYADGSTSSTAYDATTGRKLSETDQDGHTTLYTYYANGDLWQVTLPAVVDGLSTSTAPVNPVYTYTYDTYGNLLTQKDPLGHTTTYATDGYGHRVQETLPDLTNAQTWHYNALGQLDQATDFDGQVTTYTYDDQGRTAAQVEYATATDANAGHHAVKTVTYTYDNVDSSGRRYDTVQVSDTVAFNDNGTTTTSYDAEGRMVEVDTPANGSTPAGQIHYAYDPATGQKSRTWTTDPTNPGHIDTDIHYTYDGTGRLATVEVVALDGAALANHLVTSYYYDLDDDLVATQEADNTWEYRTYDALGRLLQVEDVSANNTVLAGFTYQLDKAGQRQVEVSDAGRTVNSVTFDAQGRVTLGLGGSPGRTVNYTYDADGRLTSEQMTNDPTAANRTISYTYDLAGNRATKVDSGAGGTTDTYTDDADDRLRKDVQTVTGTSTVLSNTQSTYDPDGNTKTITVTNGGGAVTSFTTETWNIDGTLAEVSTTAGSTTTTDYAYDAAGNRVAQRTGGVTTSYLNDPSEAYDQALEEYSGGMRSATYVRGLDLLFEDRVNQSGGSTQSFYAVDGLGSTRALVNAAGSQVTDTYTYDAFGNTIAQTGTTTNLYQFAGQGLDSATGLYHMGARYYEATVGRLTSRDTFEGRRENPITTNHYLYAGANPVDNFDPTGHDLLSTTISIGIGLTISGLDAAIAGKSPREIIISAALGGLLGAFGPALASVKYLRSVVGGGAIALGLIGTYQAYEDGKFGLAAFRGVTTFASLTLLVTAAAQSGVLRPLLPAGRIQVGQLAAKLGIRSMQGELRSAENVDVLKAAMLENAFRYNSPEGQIAGFRTPNGDYYVNAGNHRMEAALEILAQNGDKGPLNSLLRYGAWTQVPSAPSGSTSWSALAESLLPNPFIVFPGLGAIAQSLGF